MGSTRPGSNEERHQIQKSGCKHFSSGYLGNPQECQKDPDENSPLSVRRDDKSYFSPRYRAAVLVNLQFMLAASPIPPAANQNHWKDHSWVVGTRPPGLCQQVCSLLQGKAGSLSSVPFVIYFRQFSVAWGFPRYVAVAMGENGKGSVGLLLALSGICES